MNHRMNHRMISGALGVGVALVIAASSYAQNAPVRVRGTIEKVDGNILSVKARDGSLLTVKLAANGVVVALVKASLSDIKPGGFVGVTALPETDGSWKAVEVHIFPEAMRGTGEGDRSWDLLPKSTMTNATVAESVSKVEGPTLTLKYKEGEKKIFIPADAAIVTYVPAEPSELKPGAKIFIAAAVKQADGTLEAPRINVGRDGLAPPM